MRPYRLLLSSTTALAALLALAGPALAQDSGASATLPTIDVTGQRPMQGQNPQAVQGIVAGQDTTATKTSTPLLETPQSIHVVTRREMDLQNTQTVRNLLTYLPGVFFSNDANNRLDTIQARGFSIDQYLDGLRLQGGTWAAPKVEPFLLDSAQLLLGPASVLYGQASPGGLLNMQSRLPTDQASHEMQIQAGSNDYWRGSLDMNGKLNEDGTLLGRITGTAWTNDTQVDHQKEQRINIAPSITWRPDNDTSLTLLGNYLYDPHAGFWDQLPLQGTLQSNIYGPISRSFFVGDEQFEKFSRQQASLGYQFSHRLNDTWSFAQNLRYMQINTDYREIQGSVLAADQRTMARNAYTSDENLNTLAVDNRAEARFATGPLSHTLLLGVDYQYSRWRNFTRYGTAPSLDILNPNSNMAGLLSAITLPVFQNAIQEQNQLGAYVQDQIKLGGFNLLLAGRQDWYTNAVKNRIPGGAQTNASADHFSGHAGLNYVFSNGLAPYVSYASSFQPLTGTSRTGSAFRPTTGEQYEGGVKYQPRGLNALFTAAVFRVTQDNVATPDPVDLRYSVQTGQVRSRGVELSAVTTPLPGLNIRAAYTYMDNEITKNNTASTVGKTSANVPKNMAALFASYTFQDNALLHGLTVGGGGRYVDSRYTSAANTLGMPAYMTFDALVSYDLGASIESMKGATISVNGTNIGNKRYEAVCGALGCYYGLGRTVIASLDYKW